MPSTPSIPSTKTAAPQPTKPGPERRGARADKAVGQPIDASLLRQIGGGNGSTPVGKW